MEFERRFRNECRGGTGGGRQEEEYRTGDGEGRRNIKRNHACLVAPAPLAAATCVAPRAPRYETSAEEFVAYGHPRRRKGFQEPRRPGCLVAVVSFNRTIIGRFPSQPPTCFFAADREETGGMMGTERDALDWRNA